MKVARYWARVTGEAVHEGVTWPITLVRGSDVSEQDAREVAERDAERWCERMHAGEEPPDSYDYPDRAHPEPIVDEILDADGTRLAAVTVNRQGCSVLNTARVVFVDVDLKFPKPGGGAISRLFGGGDPRRAKQKEEQIIAGALAPLDAYVGANPGSGARVYRTAAGLRYLFVVPGMDPAGEEAAALFKQLRADKRYAKMCRVQQSFRARLSPKAWRMPMDRPPCPIRYDTYDDPRVRSWLETYAERSASFSVCKLVREMGSRSAVDEAARVIELHDAATGVGIDLPLA